MTRYSCSSCGGALDDVGDDEIDPVAGLVAVATEEQQLVCNDCSSRLAKEYEGPVRKVRNRPTTGAGA